MTTCASEPCESVLANEEPDMRMGDTCLLCLCRECERCGASIDLDAEHQVWEPPIHDKGARVPIPKQGYIDVCDNCLLPTDRPYGNEGRWVPVPPAHLGDDLDEWVETCPQDRLILTPTDDEAHCHEWEWVTLEADQELIVDGVLAVAIPVGSDYA